MLLAIEHVVIAVTHRARGERGCIRARARLGQAVTGKKLHRAQFRQPLCALGVRSVGIDHPGGHVVDRHIGRHGRAAGGQRLEDQCRVEAREPRAADIGGDVDPAHAERGGFAHFGNRKMLGFVPGERVRREHLGGEGAGHVANRDLVFAEGKLRWAACGWIEHGAVAQPGRLFGSGAWDSEGFCVKMPELAA